MYEDNRPANLMLGALSVRAYQNLLPKLERVELHAGERLYDMGDDFTHVHFVESGIIAMLVVTDKDSAQQCCMVGYEGMIGMPVFLGIKTSGNRAVVQASGTALRLRVDDFREECSIKPKLYEVMQLFTYATITQIARGSACNRFHSNETRLARWMLMAHDRLKSNSFRITQEFMSYMLGVRREAVSKIATSFQNQKLIKYSRGDFSILNRKGLEAISCNCYQVIAAN